VVLRKGGKPDYTIPGAYRPIALLDTIGKVMASVMKGKIQHYTEKLQLLPNMQFGGRSGCTTTDSLHTLMSFVKDSWRKGEEVLALFLDVKGAFPNTVPQVLIHDMRRYGVPREITDWIADKMMGRETVIKFDDYESEPIAVNNGLDQGCNLSMFLYRFYNASQIEAAVGKKDELATNFADDAILATAAPTLQEAAEKMRDLFQRQDGPAEWSRTHFSTYEYHKLAAMALTRKRIPNPEGGNKRVKQPPMTIHIDEQHTVTTVRAYKFLGVLLDDELRFKEHAAYALGKGTKWVGQVKRLSKMAKGMHGQHMRTLYQAVALPSMLYAADIWCTPPMKIGGGRVTRGMGTAIAKMEMVQRKAALQMTGTLRTTPSDLLFAHADLIPLREHITTLCQRAALRVATLPREHPLSKRAIRAMKRRPKKHPSPLHDILHLARIKKQPIEMIPTTSKPPGWKCQMKIVIPESREEAEKGVKEDESDIKIFTDGSGVGGQIGAAAVFTHGPRPIRIARCYLGKEAHHTVYEGECTGQILALRMLQENPYPLHGMSAMIATDNQAAMRAHSNRKHGAGSYLIGEATRILQDVLKKWPTLKVTLRWVPGHEGIEGNERADKEAKRAAEGLHQNRRANFGALAKQLPASKSATLQKFKRQAKERHQKAFRSQPRYERISRIEPKAPSPAFRQLSKKLTRSQTSIIAQLRTGHIPLQSYLHRFKLTESPICPGCEEEPETVMHYLKVCREHGEARRALRRELGRDVEIGMELLGEKKNIRKVLRFIAETGRFQETHKGLEAGEGRN